MKNKKFSIWWHNHFKAPICQFIIDLIQDKLQPFCYKMRWYKLEQLLDDIGWWFLKI